MKAIIIFFSIFIFFTVNSAAQDKNAELLDAVFNEEEKMSFQLIKAGADPNAATAEGVTPLMYAADQGNMYLCKLLINSGANVNAKPTNGLTALHAATKNNHTEVIQYLILQGAEPEAEDENSRTALHYACAYGFPRAADLLLYYGASPDKRDYLNRLLIITAFYGDSLMTALLLEYGADPNLPGYFKDTPLMAASQQNHLLIVKMLIEAGADIGMRNNQNMSALDIAVYAGHKDIVEYLLSQGAKSSKNIDEGISTSEVAKIEGHFEIEKLLIKEKQKPAFTDGRFSGAFVQNTSFDDYWLGTELTFHQSAINAELTAGWQNRPFRKKVLYRQDEHLYHQYREYLSAFYLAAHKNFSFVKKGYMQTGIYAGAAGTFYFLNHKGIQAKDNVLKAIPQAGIFWYGRAAGLKAAYEYAPFDYIDNKPHRFSLSLKIFINKQFRYTEKYMYY